VAETTLPSVSFKEDRAVRMSQIILNPSSPVSRSFCTPPTHYLRASPSLANPTYFVELFRKMPKDLNEELIKSNTVTVTVSR